MIPDELDIEDISDIRRLSRVMLLAALFLTDLPDGEIALRAVEYNAFAPGWDIGTHAMGSRWPSHTGIRFSPQELDTVVRLARYFLAAEQAAAPEEGVTA